MHHKMAASRSRALRLTNDSEQKAQRKSTRKSGRKAVQKNGEKTVDGIEERVECGVDERIEVSIGERTKGEDQREETCDGNVRCICACNMEKGEMVCCDMCEGWTHLSCLGMKEGVGGMVGKEYVCHFCVSSCLLALRREVEGLRKELKEVREENGRMKSCLEQERLEDARVTQVEMKENMPSCGKVTDTGDRLEESRLSGQQASSQRRQASGVEVSKSKGQKGTCKTMGGWKEVKRSSKGVQGVRKVWGTRKKVSCNDVAKEMVKTVGRVGSQFSIMKQVDKLKGKNRWWFIVKAPEKSLQDLDKKWKHEHWRWQKVHIGESAFLGVGPVSIRHR